MPNKSTFPALPLVSIVTPVLNCERFIEKCIQSVLHQDYPNIEHIIVDGVSTDKTLKICKKYPHLIIHSKKDRGQSHAINKGFSMAQGQILAWLCADDEYKKGAVFAAVKEVSSGHDVVMGNSHFIDAEDNIIAAHPANAYPFYNHDMFLRFWQYNPISQPAVFWSRKMWETCGPLRENYYFAMDYDLWLRMSQKSNFQRLNIFTAKYRIHSDAKCFSDNYGSRIELIRVSKKYWPSRWKPGFWKLYFKYLITRGPITKHYSDGEKLLAKTITYLDNSKRLKALYFFIKAHFKHVATPYLPSYGITLHRILVYSIGPSWFWNRIIRFYQSIRNKNL